MHFLQPSSFSPHSVSAGAVIAAVLLIALGGFVVPGSLSGGHEALQGVVLEDLPRLQLAVSRYLEDNGDFPATTFDLSEGFQGGLVHSAFVPWAHQATWNGPYLFESMSRPTTNSFWGVVAPRCAEDTDGDGEQDELWARLHRGFGEIDDQSAALLDALIDDGDGEEGRVRVTSSAIWFFLAEK